MPTCTSFVRALPFVLIITMSMPVAAGQAPKPRKSAADTDLATA
jgi:hypothetical protein